ncbi:class IV adenylate cyclase [Candidatus Woesearchaeota archaeon]|nr:class IV adenylate cyclase [Candidatus Woesearchaeota archaeon]
MAIGNTEIEIKIPLEKDEFLRIRENLRSNARFLNSSHQVDEYFSPAHRDFLKPQHPFEWLRIGKRSGKTIINYKHWYPENADKTTHCDEFETVVHSPEQLRLIFGSLDMRPLVTVDKQRDIFVHNNELEIALDEVKELGYFMEIETMKDFGSVDAARDALFSFARSLNIDASRYVPRGYPFLLMEKRGLM